jgi:transcriptional regulator with XRE-family HTH domain
MAKRAGPASIDATNPQNIAQWAWSNDEGQAMPIGERIKTLRGERQLSQADLATKIGGTDAGQISRYENSHIAPSADAIVRLAEALDVSCDYLLVEDAPRRPFRAPEHVLGEHLVGLDELTDEDLRALLHMLDALVAKNRVKAALTSRAS